MRYLPSMISPIMDGRNIRSHDNNVRVGGGERRWWSDSCAAALSKRGDELLPTYTRNSKDAPPRVPFGSARQDVNRDDNSVRQPGFTKPMMTTVRPCAAAAGVERSGRSQPGGIMTLMLHLRLKNTVAACKCGNGAWWLRSYGARRTARPVATGLPHLTQRPGRLPSRRERNCRSIPKRSSASA